MMIFQWYITMHSWIVDFNFLNVCRPSACLQVQTDSPSLKRLTMVQEEEKSRSVSHKRASTGSITFSVNIQCDLIIVHPGAVLSILHLLPASEFEGQLVVSTKDRKIRTHS